MRDCEKGETSVVVIFLRVGDILGFLNFDAKN